MNARAYMQELNKVCQFHSKERTGNVTNSELKRWLVNQSVLLNSRRIKWNEEMDFPVTELVLFPKKNRTTIL